MNKALEDQTRIILDSIADGVFTVDGDSRITSFNRAAEDILGLSRQEAIGRYCWEVFKASICEQRCSLRQTMETGQPIVNQPIFIVNSEGERIPVSISTALLRDAAGNVLGAVETFRDLSVVEQLRKALDGRHSFHDIISKNNEMQRLFSMLELISQSDATVLLEGESGTGKELFARALHNMSPRRAGPLVVVNCGALPDTLLESELFGYKSGAFTDARKDKPGRLALADGGTLFLDEIGDISPMLQVRLLRFLQTRSYEPLGGVKPETADVRVVAATHRNLTEEVQRGRFREDLFYRINVARLHLPPLRERREDIPLLMRHFIQKFSSLAGKQIQDAAPEVLSLLMAHPFPGNIRELENIVEFACIVCRDGVIRPEHLPEQFRSAASVTHPSSQAAEEKGACGPSLKVVERDFLVNLLQECGWSRTAAAARLGVHPTTLWRKLKRLGVKPPPRSADTPR